MLNEQERGVRCDRVQKQSSEAKGPRAPLDNDVKDDGFVNKVGEDARERHEAAGFRIAEREDYVGVLDHAPHIRECPAVAPRFALKHTPKLLDLVARQAADKLRFGFAGRDHEAPGDRTAVSSRAQPGISRRRERGLAASFRDKDIPHNNGVGYGKYRCRSIEM